jgi:ParB-like chromosome segregation protein Spo0J
MPQIYDATEFAKTIKTKYGVKSAIKKVEVQTLRPSQNEISSERVSGVIQAIKDGSLDKNPMVISADGYVVDGHHRWAAYKKHKPTAKLPVLVIDLPIKEALGLAIAVSKKREQF